MHTRSKWEHFFFTNTDAWKTCQLHIYILIAASFSSSFCTPQFTYQLCDCVFLCCYRHQCRQCALLMLLMRLACRWLALCVCVCRWNFSSLFICFYLHFDLTACHFILFLFSILKHRVPLGWPTKLTVHTRIWASKQVSKKRTNEMVKEEEEKSHQTSSRTSNNTSNDTN